jgi:hypothetical protein
MGGTSALARCARSCGTRCASARSSVGRTVGSTFRSTDQVAVRCLYCGELNEGIHIERQQRTCSDDWHRTTSIHLMRMCWPLGGRALCQAVSPDGRGDLATYSATVQWQRFLPALTPAQRHHERQRQQRVRLVARNAVGSTHRGRSVVASVGGTVCHAGVPSPTSAASSMKGTEVPKSRGGQSASGQACASRREAI